MNPAYCRKQGRRFLSDISLSSGFFIRFKKQNVNKTRISSLQKIPVISCSRENTGNRIFLYLSGCLAGKSYAQGSPGFRAGKNVYVFFPVLKRFHMGRDIGLAVLDIGPDDI